MVEAKKANFIQTLIELNLKLFRELDNELPDEFDINEKQIDLIEALFEHKLMQLVDIVCYKGDKPMDDLEESLKRRITEIS